MAKLEEFSGGYYRAEMTVQPLDRGPAIERGLYDLINREIYYQTDAPVMMRLGLNADAPTFEPSAENGMPTDVLGLPEAMLDMAGVHPSAEDVSVFIYKPEAAYLFQDISLGNSRNEDVDLDEADEQFFNLSDY